MVVETIVVLTTTGVPLTVVEDISVAAHRKYTTKATLKISNVNRLSSKIKPINEFRSGKIKSGVRLGTLRLFMIPEWSKVNMHVTTPKVAIIAG
eukprot:12095736-Ditylum_brightwellii.AAC.1